MTVVRYSLLRLLIFFGVLMVLWLVGIRDNPVLLIALSAVISAVASLLLLRDLRDDMTLKLVERHEARLERKEAARNARERTRDELDEDAEADRAFGDDTPR